MNNTQDRPTPQRPGQFDGPRTRNGYDSRKHDRPDVPAAGAPPSGTQPRDISPDQWAIDTVLDRLRYWRPSGTGYAARCPAHADYDPSLSINETSEGHVLLFCHRGCSADAVLDAMGLEAAHLFTSEYARRFGKRRDGRRAPSAGYSQSAGRDPVIDHARFQNLVTTAERCADGDLNALAEQLGMSIRDVRDFRIGFNGRAYTFCECDAQMRPVGAIYRTLTAEKRAAAGSHRGLTVPAVDRGYRGRVFVAEGATDTIALHSVGLRAVGRPAATLSVLAFKWLVAYLIDNGGAGVVIVGDNDAPDENGRRVGRDAAKELALNLTDVLPKYPVAWGLPPKQFKDVRQQIVSGDWSLGLCMTEVRP